MFLTCYLCPLACPSIPLDTLAVLANIHSNHWLRASLVILTFAWDLLPAWSTFCYTNLRAHIFKIKENNKSWKTTIFNKLGEPVFLYSFRISLLPKWLPGTFGGLQLVQLEVDLPHLTSQENQTERFQPGTRVKSCWLLLALCLTWDFQVVPR